MLDATVGALGWYLLGYGFAYGDKLDDNGNNIGAPRRLSGRAPAFAVRGSCRAAPRLAADRQAASLVGAPVFSHSRRRPRCAAGNGFIGSRWFAFKDLPRGSFYSWFFQYTFAGQPCPSPPPRRLSSPPPHPPLPAPRPHLPAPRRHPRAATASTIVSGSVIERAQISAYCGYSFFLCAFVYPVVAHWEWSNSGWLSAFRSPSVGPKLFGSGLVDFAGCGAVHMVGGVSGIVGAYIIGPRIGRYSADGRAVPQPGHNVALQALGTMCLWRAPPARGGGAALSASRPVHCARRGAAPRRLCSPPGWRPTRR